jgi:hypothetical protein
MPNDNSGDPVERESTEQPTSGEPTNPPPPPNNPHPAPAQSISRQEVQSEVQGIEDRVKRAELWMIWLTAAIAFSGFCAVGVGLMQWREIHAGSTDTHDLAVAAKDQAGKMKDMSDAADKIRQAAEGMVAQEKRLADKTEESLRASNQQSRDALNASIKAARSDQRAWLGNSNWSYVVNESDPIKATVMITNVGKSPATSIICRMDGGTFPKGHTLTDADLKYSDTAEMIEEGTIFPAQRFPLSAIAIAIQADLQKAWFQAVDNGDQIQYFWGYVTYDDAFGRNHWTHFCAIYRPKTKDSAPCRIHNDTDDTKQKAN